MKFGDFFTREWECMTSMIDPCWGPDDKDANKALHSRCRWRYVADLNEYDYETLKDARLVK